MTTRKNAFNSPYGCICDYKSSDSIRSATRNEWLYAREQGDPQTGAYEDLVSGRTVFCDGPATEADPNVQWP